MLWLTVKATQLEAALTTLRDPASVRMIVPLLNGIDHVALLRTRYGFDRVTPATIAVETERVGPGQFVQRSPFVRLNLSPSGRTLLGDTLDRLQKIGFVCNYVKSEPTLLWSKLVFLAPFALTTTAADKTAGEILSDPIWRRLWENCVREACSAAVAEGATADPDAVLASTVGMPPGLRSSMQKDVEQHKTPELDAIAGPIVRNARRHQLAVPATEELIAAVERRSGVRGS